MVFVEFTKFYRKTCDSFEKIGFDKNILYDIYAACLTDLIYNETEDIFINHSNGRKFEYDEENLNFYPKYDKIYPKRVELRDNDFCAEFDSTNSFRITYANNNDLIIVGGKALNHTKKIFDEPINIDYKWLYYYVFPDVINKLKEVKLYDDNGDIIPLTINNASYFLQYIKDVKDICKIEVEANSIESLEKFKMMKNYTSYLDEVEKINTLKSTLNNVVTDDLSGVEIDYTEGFAQAIELAKGYYKDINKDLKEGNAFLRR